jgi:2-dehydro-3-deoxy-D-arabinonate dehydratase
MTSVKLYHAADKVIAEIDGTFRVIDEGWDNLIARPGLLSWLREHAPTFPAGTLPAEPRAPIQSQEVWAAGVTYFRSRAARIEESQDAGGGTFYDRVYTAARPELFFKSAPWRVRGPQSGIRIRRDANWSVPEPELALYINPRGEIIGYTVGNDVSSRDIEGENPLYLPQAKTYDGSCSLGPALLLTDVALPPETSIALTIQRAGAAAFEGATTLAQMRRTPEELVSYLFRELSFPNGCVLLTGTGVIPPDAFTLQSGDIVSIIIPAIGTLVNTVE